MANKFGNKLAPNDKDLPKILRTTQSQDLAGAPKGPRTGALVGGAPKPPVGRGQRGRKGTPVNS